MILAAFLLLVLLLLLLTRRRSQFPGPPRLPLMGSLPWLTKTHGFGDWVLDPLVTRHKIAVVQIGPMALKHVINDFHTAKALMGMDVFSARAAPKAVTWHKSLTPGRPEGIVSTSGAQWSAQRRLGLRTLRDLGFGNQTLEATIVAEVDRLAKHFSKQQERKLKLRGSFFLLFSLIVHSR